MKVLLLGCGNIGSIAAEDFARSMVSAEVSVGDKNILGAKKEVKTQTAKTRD